MILVNQRTSCTEKLFSYAFPKDAKELYYR